LTTKIRVLLVDNSEEDASTLIQELRKGGYTPEYRLVNTAKQFIAALEEESWDIVFTEYLLPGFSGNAILDILKKRDGHIPVIMISGTMGEETVPVGMKSSANDYFIKGNYARLIPAVQRELRDAAMWKEHQATLQELRRSEARYRAVVEDQTEFINRYSLDGVITFANTAFARLYGKTPEEIVGLKHEDFLNDEALKTLKSIRFQLSKDYPIISSQHCHVFPNGGEVWLQWHDRLILDAAGKPIEYQGVGRDISELKTAETDLKKFAENLERYATQLQVAAEIAREAATFHGLDSLLKKAVDLVRDGFGFYHTAVFLINEDGEYAILTAASGEGGERLLARGHKLKIGETGIISHVAITGQPRISQDVGKDAIHMKQPLLPETRSEMAVPLKVMDKVIGIFDIQSRKRAAFDGNDLIALQTMANQLAIAVDNIRLFTETQQRSQELASLYAAAIAISNILDTDTLLERLYQQVQRMIAPDTVMVSLYEPRDETFIVALAIENGKPVTEFLNKRYPVAEGGLTGWVLRNRQPLLIGDIDNDLLPIKPIPGVKPVHAWLGVPLMSRAKLLGAFSIQSFQPNVFDESHQRFLESLAAQSAIAIENANFFNAERLAREKAEALRDAAQVISSTLSLDQVIETVLEQLARVLPYDSACVFLVEDDGVRIQAGHGYEKYTDPGNLSATTLPLDAPVVKEIVESEKMVMIPDIRTYPGWIKTPLSDHIRSYLGVPLRARNQVIGFFSLDRVTPGGFSDEDLEIAAAFAAQTSAAIENARLFEAEEKRVAALETLRQVSLGLTASLEPGRVLDSILDGVFELIPDVEDAHIFSYDGETLTFESSLWHDGRRGEIFSEPRKDGLTYKTAQSGEAIVINDFTQHPMFKEKAALENWKGSIVGIPIKIGERVVGVLNVAHQETHAFKETELRMLRLMGDQAALAIENANLFEQTMMERRHISLLYDVGQAMAVTLDPDTIAERAIELTCQAMGASVGAIWIRDAEGDNLYLIALYVKGITAIDPLDRDTELRMDQESTLVGWAARQNLAINIPDVSVEERWTEIPYIDEVISSMIASPISDGQNLLGSMAILHPKVSAFTDDHQDLLQSICHQVGLALSNARRYQDINRLVDLLAAEQNRLESLIEMLPVGVLLLDADCHLLVANPLGKEILSVLSPSTTDNVITYLGDIPLMELLGLQPTTLPLEISVNNPKFGIYEIQTLQIGGESIQWVLTLRDVTYEREIQERVQMQNRLATVGQLAAGIAHDFNNIMAAIVVYADLLMMEPSLSDASQEKLAVIQQQIQRASSLIRQILDFSRRSIMEKSKLDLLPFMKEMQKLLERTLPETMRIELKAEDAEYTVMADPTRMQQVFMNLALNARDAMENGGCLSFYLERVHYARDIDPPIIDMPTGEWIRISVRDTGAGIPPENLTRIFEPFFTTKPVGQGTGLGLAQVYGIVRQHEGYLDVKSQLQKGTQFDIFLPVLLAEQTDHESADDARQLDGSGKTVLVVEDDDTTRAALQALLNAQHFDVLLASNGNEAIKLLNKDHHKIVLVISDIVMPEMGGMDLFTIMQIQWPHIRMLLITGHPLDNQVQGVLERSNMVWLPKPFSITDVNKSIGKLLAESN
jgi:PAS domain S-box-containing protein